MMKASGNDRVLKSSERKYSTNRQRAGSKSHSSMVNPIQEQELDSIMSKITDPAIYK